MVEMLPEQEEKRIKEFNEAFDVGEVFDKNIVCLDQKNPLLQQEISRLLRSVESYYKTYSKIEEMQKKRGLGNFTAQDFEESDRTRMIYHNAIIDSIKKISEISENERYFYQLLEKSREEIGKWALNLAKYRKFKKQKEAA